jgi:hypothetical protein
LPLLDIFIDLSTGLLRNPEFFMAFGQLLTGLLRNPEPYAALRADQT